MYALHDFVLLSVHMYVHGNYLMKNSISKGSMQSIVVKQEMNDGITA